MQTSKSTTDTDPNSSKSQQSEVTTEPLLPSPRPDKPTEDTRALEFSSLQDIKFWYFCKQVGLFSINYFFLMIPILLSYVLFNFRDDQQSIAIIGACYITCELLFSFSIDFQEALGIVLGPIYSAEDYRKYSDSMWQMLLICVLLTAVAAPAIYALPSLFGLMGVDESIRADCLDFAGWYVLAVVPVYTLSNFSKGLIGVHQLQRYNLVVNFASFVIFTVIISALVCISKLGYNAFVISYSVKFLAELVINTVIIYRKSRRALPKILANPSPCRNILPTPPQPSGQKPVVPGERGVVFRTVLLCGVRRDRGAPAVPAQAGAGSSESAVVQRVRANRVSG